MNKIVKVVHPGDGFNRIIIEQSDAEESIGGLVIPNADKPTQGKVLQTSKGCYNKDGELQLPLCRIGDIVQYDKNAGIKLVIGDVEYILLNENYIYVIQND